MIKYKATNERGRQAVEDSLAAAVESIAFVSNHEPKLCVTAQERERVGNLAVWIDVWYVYGTQLALDADLARGPITVASPNWFAVVHAVEKA